MLSNGAKKMKKILVIDDVIDNLIAMKETLEDLIHDCLVLTTQSGIEGLKIARKEDPNTIITDIIMPEIKGYEICKKLSEDEATKYIPVIILTGSKTDTESRIKCLESGADVFLSKPIDATELTAQIHAMFRIKESEDKLRAEREYLDETVKKRTKELRESEERLKLFMNSATDNFTLWSSDLHLLEINRNALQLFPDGTKREDVIGKSMLELNPNLKDSERYDKYLEVIKTGIPFYMDDYIPDIGKGEMHLALKVFAAGEGMGMITSDITKRKQTEEALKESEFNLRSLFNAMVDVVLEVNYEGRLINIAPTSPDLLNKTPVKVLGKTLHEIFPKSEAEKFLELIHKCLDENSIVTIEYSLKIKDNILWFEGRGTPKTENTVLYIAHNITERKKVEKALQESEERYRLVLETTRELIVINDFDGNIIFANKAASDLLEIDKEEIKGNDIREFLSQNGVKEMEKEIENRIAGFSGPTLFERKIISKSGQEYFIEIDSTIFIDAKGNKRVLTIGRNITKRKQIEEELKKRLNELEIFNAAAVGRELMINELRKEINELLKKLGKEPKYDIVV